MTIFRAFVKNNINYYETIFLTLILAISTMALSAQTLERMQWFNEPENWSIEDNTPVMVGVMAACPDGNGFKAKFEHFKIKHLPDQRRLEWLKNNQ